MDWLSYNGFGVITKRATVLTRYIPTLDSDTPVEEVKGNINIELTVDAYHASAHCNTIVIFSGNGEIAPLISLLKKRGCLVGVVSSSQTADTTIATELVRQSNAFLDLATNNTAVSVFCVFLYQKEKPEKKSKKKKEEHEDASIKPVDVCPKHEDGMRVNLPKIRLFTLKPSWDVDAVDRFTIFLCVFRDAKKT